MRCELKLSNKGSGDWKFTLEPWGEDYFLPKGHTFTLVIEAPETPDVEIEVSDSQTIVAINGPMGSEAWICDGDTVVRGR